MVIVFWCLFNKISIINYVPYRKIIAHTEVSEDVNNISK